MPLYLVLRYDEMAERRTEKGLANDCAKIVAIKSSKEELRTWLHKNLPSLGEHEKYCVIEQEGLLMKLTEGGKINEFTSA